MLAGRDRRAGQRRRARSSQTVDRGRRPARSGSSASRPASTSCARATRGSSRRPRSCASARGRRRRSSSCSTSRDLTQEITVSNAAAEVGASRRQQRRRDHDRPGHARQPAGLRQRLRRDDVAVSRRRVDRQRRRHDRRQRHGSQRAERQRVGDAADPDQPGSVLGRILPAGPRADRDPDEARHAAVPRRGHADLPRRARSTRAMPFAATKPPEQRRIYEGFLGGPLGHGRQDVVHALGERRDPGSAGVHLRARADGHHPGHAAAQERPGAGHRQHHASDQRQEHLLDPAELPIRERREPRRRRHDAGQRGHDVQASRAAGHLHAADDPAADAGQPVPDARRPRARADRQRLRPIAASSSTARSPAAAARPTWCGPKRTST